MSYTSIQADQTALQKLLNFRLPPQKNLLIFNLLKTPAEYVEFERAGHFAFSDLNGNKKQENLISHYCVQFLDKYVLAKPTAKPEEKLDGVSFLETK